MFLWLNNLASEEKENACLVHLNLRGNPL